MTGGLVVTGAFSDWTSCSNRWIVTGGPVVTGG